MTFSEQWLLAKTFLQTPLQIGSITPSSTDSWYPSSSVLQCSVKQGFHVISGLKTNRIFYPQGIRQSLKNFASYISKSDTDLVTIGSSAYRVYRYEGKLNLIENAVLLLCWEESDELDPKRMKAF